MKLKAEIIDGNIKRPFLRQYYLFVKALIEVYKNVDESEVSVDHSNGRCYYKNKEYGIIFPKKWIGLIEKNTKDIDFFFSGYKNRKNPEVRSWVLEYTGEKSVIGFSNNGRRIPRDYFDPTFFVPMSKSKFALCPQGFPYKWTYRFYEAILCHSVPILNKDDVVQEYLDYKFFIHNTVNIKNVTDELRNEMAESNYKIALDKLFLN